jgi:hypothetical protein
MIIPSSAGTARAQGECRPQSEGVTITAYRGRTLALLRRYFHMSLDVGRLPSLLGREFFRARVTSYHMHSFEDVVILVHDVERCLERLDDFSRSLVARIVLQDYNWDETALLMNCSRRTVARRFPRILDRLSEIFLGLLRPFPSASGHVAPACQEGGDGENPATSCVTRE